MVIKIKTTPDSSTGNFLECRRILVGPGVNEPDPCPGCTGFYGWESLSCLKSNEMLCCFSGGYWHASFPRPADIESGLRKRMEKSGFPSEVHAPTGGRAFLMRSNDFGKTWTKPVTLIDTPFDDRHPVICEMPDASLVCGFFILDSWYGYESVPEGKSKNSRVCSIRSMDGGFSWTKPVYMPSPFKYYDRMCSDLVLLKSGSLLFPTYGMDSMSGPAEMALYRTDDMGESWYFVSRLKSEISELDEPAICQNAKGELIMISRPDSELAFSGDEGKSWTSPVSLGIKRMIAPNLITLKNGIIACIFGRDQEGGGIEIIWSEDNGRTWIAPAGNKGFSIDNSVYFYANGCELPDGSIYIVYYAPAEKQTKTSILAIRVRIRPDSQGIDILPVKQDMLKDTVEKVNISSDSSNKIDIDSVLSGNPSERNYE